MGPAALVPLAIQLAQFVPGIIKALGGDKAGEVAETVVSVAEAVTGTGRDQVVESLKADPAALLQFQTKVLEHQSQWMVAEVNARRDVIVAEAQGESVLQRNWRPATMLGLVGMIAGWWFGWVEHGSHITEAMVLAVLDIVQFGLSGYVVGRSAEKIAPHLKGLFGARG